MRVARQVWALAGLVLVAGGTLLQRGVQAQADPRTMKAIAKVSPRFQSYNVEMVEVIGGRFWKPYTSTAVKDMPVPSGLIGMDPALYEQRTPINLSNPRLRMLAAALGPAYLRVSGSWANTAYFQDADAPAPAAPPKGFGGVLTRAEWKGVADFARAVDAKLVTSFGVTTGNRDSNGVWQPQQAEALLRYSKSVGAPIAAAEFFNEPTFAGIAGVAKEYSGADYARDYKAFVPVFRREAPGAVLLGPGSVGEGAPLASGMMKMLPSKDMLAAGGAEGIDGFSYHFYPTVSERCAAHAPASMHMGTTPDQALSNSFLQTTDTVESFYAGLRDQYAPGKPMWLTETGQAACGGDRWAATYLDTFRYLYQLGTLARRNVQVVMHNTLAASDYGLIDEKSLLPRPDYWAALLWHNLMGTTVLDASALQAKAAMPARSDDSTHMKVFAQCTKDRPGDVTVLVMNLDGLYEGRVQFPEGGQRYTLTTPTGGAAHTRALTGDDLSGSTIMLNGEGLALNINTGAMPVIKGNAIKADAVQRLAPASSTFFTLRANNPACR